MIYQVFSVRDSKAAAYALPFFLPRMEVALRSFRDAVKNPEHDMHRHPEDYALYCLGEFNDETGELHKIEPVLVAQASDPAQRPDLRPVDQIDHSRAGGR